MTNTFGLVGELDVLVGAVVVASVVASVSVGLLPLGCEDEACELWKYIETTLGIDK